MRSALKWSYFSTPCAEIVLFRAEKERFRRYPQFFHRFERPKSKGFGEFCAEMVLFQLPALKWSLCPLKTALKWSFFASQPDFGLKAFNHGGSNEY